MKAFHECRFLLPDASAQRLYHEYAAGMPILDYHCHLPPADIASNAPFKYGRAWLASDHYKWRVVYATVLPKA